ncbi:hypothetical protein E2C01_099711 [Portunus trituberculatus]|uniref:Uncharacterized protein n=1 Tax=Portunus trituberculatus TaxID=210409 RepID=A0A5B7K678_PORTR|nr:hypothetical protein [Portunus trituberculatus]
MARSTRGNKSSGGGGLVTQHNPSLNYLSECGHQYRGVAGDCCYGTSTEGGREGREGLAGWLGGWMVGQALELRKVMPVHCIRTVSEANYVLMTGWKWTRSEAFTRDSIGPSIRTARTCRADRQ